MRLSPAAPIQRKTRGLVWHTQGSGKTFTLLTAAKLILDQKERFKNATVILVVDRTELEGQLKGWVERVLGEMQNQDIAIKRASTKAELQQLLDADFRGLIIAMIHKFEAIRKDSSVRDNVYVFIDEAHRSVAKDPRHLPDGLGAKRDHHRLHWHADRQYRAGEPARSRFSGPKTKPAIWTNIRSRNRSPTRPHFRSSTSGRRVR